MQLNFSLLTLTAFIGLISASPLEKRADKYCKIPLSKSTAPCHINPQGNTPGTVRTNISAGTAFWADCRKSWQTPNGYYWIKVKADNYNQYDCFVSSAYVASNDGSGRCEDNLDICAEW